MNVWLRMADCIPKRPVPQGPISDFPRRDAAILDALQGRCAGEALGRPVWLLVGAPATRGCPGVAQVANKAAGSSLKALGVTFGPHLPASALSGASGQQAWHLRARARALHY